MTLETRRTVLVIEDNPLDAAVLDTILREEHRVRVATTPDAALRALHEGPAPDLILLDVVMPGADGLDLCRRIKSEEDLAGIPIIFVTSRTEAADEEAGFGAGAVDYITKPVNPHLLRARVRTHLELAGARKEMERQNVALRETVALRELAEQVARHDLKNPLMVILNVALMLLRRPGMDPQVVSALEMVEGAARRIAELVNRSVDLFRMERGEYRARREDVHVLAVLQNVVSSLSPLARHRRIRITVRCDEASGTTAEGPVARSEELLLYSMLANLVKNAVEASPEDGEVLVRLSVEEDIAIEIKNDGAVPPGIRDRLFQKYVTHGKAEGTGLGLYSARLIATTIGGRLAAECSDTATTMAVHLPR